MKIIIEKDDNTRVVGEIPDEVLYLSMSYMTPEFKSGGCALSNLTSVSEEELRNNADKILLAYFGIMKFSQDIANIMKDQLDKAVLGRFSDSVIKNNHMDN